jgi:hypothetical protein
MEVIILNGWNSYQYCTMHDKIIIIKKKSSNKGKEKVTSQV